MYRHIVHVSLTPNNFQLSADTLFSLLPIITLSQLESRTSRPHQEDFNTAAFSALLVGPFNHLLCFLTFTLSKFLLSPKQGLKSEEVRGQKLPETFLIPGPTKGPVHQSHRFGGERKIMT